MKENSRNINILITSLICLLVIVCATFLRINPEREEDTPPREEGKTMEIYRPQLTEQEGKEITKALNYTICLEEGVLNFYLNSEKEKVLLESTPINIEIYPGDDIKSLAESITVETLEEGISLIEDFTS